MVWLGMVLDNRLGQSFQCLMVHREQQQFIETSLEFVEEDPEDGFREGAVATRLIPCDTSVLSLLFVMIRMGMKYCHCLGCGCHGSMVIILPLSCRLHHNIVSFSG